MEFLAIWLFGEFLIFHWYRFRIRCVSSTQVSEGNAEILEGYRAPIKCVDVS